MRFLGFNKINKHKRFDYVPRYYDAEKEEFEARVKATKERVKAEKEGINNKPEFYATRISQAFQRDRQKTSLLDMGFLPSLVRLFIVFILGGAFWVYIQYGDKLGKTDSSQITTVLLAVAICLVGLILLLRMRKN